MAKYLPILIVWAAFTSEYPFSLIQAYSWHPHLYLLGVLNIIMIIWLLAKKEIKLINIRVLLIIFIQVLACILLFTIHKDQFYLRIILRMIPIIITVLYIKNVVGLDYFSITTIKIFYFLSILAILSFFLCFVGLLEPVNIYTNPDGRPAYNLIITLTNKIFYVGNILIIRVASFFDEPGTFAFYIIFFLLIGSIYNYDKKYINMLLMAGLFTFSMAFYIIIFFYFVLRKGYFKSRQYILVILVSIFLFGYIFVNKDNSPALAKLYSLTLDRFRVENKSDRIVVGDNRSQQFFMALSIFSEHPFLGYGTSNAISDYPPMNTNIIAPMAFNGFIGFLALFSHVGLLFYYLKKYDSTNKLKRLRKYILLLLLLYAQRPHVIG